MLAAQVFTCANGDKKIGSSDEIIHLSFQTLVEKITKNRNPMVSFSIGISEFRCQGPKLQRPQRPAQAAPMSTAHHGLWISGESIPAQKFGLVFFGLGPG